MTKKLPSQLVLLGKEMMNLLGDAIREEYGKKCFNMADKIRELYRLEEKKSKSDISQVHEKVYALLKKQDESMRLQLAHSFACALEIINTCENAYRSYRLDRGEDFRLPKNFEGQKFFFVLTAHPTESRSKSTLEITDRMYDALLAYLKGEDLHKEHVYTCIRMMLKVPITKPKKPEVIDEAEYIYSCLLKEQNIKVAAQFDRVNAPVYFRSWVGGDKDGHPGVDERVMLRSMTSSRNKIIALVEKALGELIADLSILGESDHRFLQFKAEVKLLTKKLKTLKAILVKDGDRVIDFKSRAKLLFDKIDTAVGFRLEPIQYLDYIFRLFPALIVPLEFREDSELVHQALKEDGMAISRMMLRLKEIKGAAKPTNYVRGFVLSMCESVGDFQAGVKLLKKNLGSLGLPVVPLFETRKALEESEAIVSEILSNKTMLATVNKNWDNKFEIMLGYSDSAKENGSLASKIMIYQTLKNLDEKISSFKVKPVFFHGSGGSVARGGGSLEDQVRWWPESAIMNYKATIQGEMVHRSFSSPQIFRRQLEKTISFASNLKKKPGPKRLRKETLAFTKKVADNYYSKIADPQFLQLVEKSSPYEYLDQLKIGSRPAKRKKSLSLKSLRAIPWVLCWTQNRLLFPVWWGLGSAWKEASEQEKSKLKEAYQKEPVFRSFVHLCSYTMLKTDLSVFEFYLNKSGLPEDQKKKFGEEIRKEHKESTRFLQQIMGTKDLAWYRPWLEQSINFRNVFIHPLNVLEKIAIENKEMPLLRESIAGVASGMLTTG
ncbi:MAG: phosphoenolpyruvate carboxylase [Bdellovibrionota bacterium]